MRNLRRLSWLVKINPEAVFVYLSYGTILDAQAIRIISKAKKHIIDVHEAIAQSEDSSGARKNQFVKLYHDRVKAVISHSERTDNFLKNFGFNGTRLFVPHFKYSYDKSFSIKDLSEEVHNAIDKNKTNILFFGNINESKGIDILLSSINLLPKGKADKLNFIVAGKDFDGCWKRVELDKDRTVHFILRHISDNELNYLYSNTAFVAMPYRKTSQSGIIETAFYFHKPIIATGIPYFKKVLTEFPSFGILSGDSTPKDFVHGIEKALEANQKHETFFNGKDLSHYEQREDFDKFRQAFEIWSKQ